MLDPEFGLGAAAFLAQSLSGVEWTGSPGGWEPPGKPLPWWGEGFYPWTLKVDLLNQATC